MAGKRLPEELRRCMEGNGCGDCDCHEPETKLTCRGLLQKAYERLRDYGGLEEQGRLLKLPCAVGDTVYQHMVVGVDKVQKKPIYETFEAIVFKFSLSSCGLCFWTETSDRGKHQNEMPLSAFGKSVFSTKGQAEAALRGMEAQ